MAIRVTVTDVIQLERGIWLFEMEPKQIGHFGKAARTIGETSILLFRDFTFDESAKHLHFDMDDVVALNVGTVSSVIGIATQRLKDSGHIYANRARAYSIKLGKGDQKFLEMVGEEISEEMKVAAEKILTKIRERSPGDLKKGERRNFYDTPDNFWYVVIQPRVKDLSITVRGSVEYFQQFANLEIKDDRGNTRFKVRSAEDVPAAIELIYRAKKKDGSTLV